jgi:hypothetical protein
MKTKFMIGTTTYTLKLPGISMLHYLSTRKYLPNFHYQQSDTSSRKSSSSKRRSSVAVTGTTGGGNAFGPGTDCSVTGKGGKTPQ